jgi:hypothetical protein
VHIRDHTFDDWVRYQRLLFGIAYWWTGSRTDAEELTQEAFFQAYRSRSSLREIDAVKVGLSASSATLKPRCTGKATLGSRSLSMR